MVRSTQGSGGLESAFQHSWIPSRGFPNAFELFRSCFFVCCDETLNKTKAVGREQFRSLSGTKLWLVVLIQVTQGNLRVGGCYITLRVAKLDTSTSEVVNPRGAADITIFIERGAYLLRDDSSSNGACHFREICVIRPVRNGELQHFVLFDAGWKVEWFISQHVNWVAGWFETTGPKTESFVCQLAPVENDVNLAILQREKTNKGLSNTSEARFRFNHFAGLRLFNK
jgi:hypothetical protein